MNRDKIHEVLKEIQEQSNKLFGKRILKEQDASPTIKFVVDKALEADFVNPEFKKKLQTLKDAGEFDKKQYVEDPKVKKQQENFMNREIRKAVKEGRLPNKKQLKLILQYEKLHTQTN